MREAPYIQPMTLSVGVWNNQDTSIQLTVLPSYGSGTMINSTMNRILVSLCRKISIGMLTLLFFQAAIAQQQESPFPSDVPASEASVLSFGSWATFGEQVDTNLTLRRNGEDKICCKECGRMCKNDRNRLELRGRS